MLYRNPRGAIPVFDHLEIKKEIALPPLPYSPYLSRYKSFLYIDQSLTNTLSKSIYNIYTVSKWLNTAMSGDFVYIYAYNCSI